MPKLHLRCSSIWCITGRRNSTIDHVDMSSITLLDYYQFLHDICSWKSCATQIQLAGVGKEVQIDESVLIRAKYNRHLRCNGEGWVHHLHESKATLLTIILREVPGFVIVLDE